MRHCNNPCFRVVPDRRGATGRWGRASLGHRLSSTLYRGR
ncbi:hypothetical protein SGUI_1197 [Serinicoccus hydrothermalis]|uniref:Uncharacterized protein n=1 Tax=Serinicoccus hydrothermalis TaxID=1758689 RepID=A0A1B1NAY4_9MICO|nr:hypothetical protein SGUI_1197 [Serinicoccus hydrothermalis]